MTDLRGTGEENARTPFVAPRLDGDGYLPPHQPYCLGCGDANPASLRVRLRPEGDRLIGHVTLDRRHEGAPGFAHGGAVATILDEALGTVVVAQGRPAVTGRLEVHYRRPVLLGSRYAIQARAGKIDGRKIEVRGELLDGDLVIAEATAVFIQVDLQHFMQGVPEEDHPWARGAHGTDALPW